MKDIKIIGLDLAKSIFYIHGVNSRGKTVLQKKLKRAELLPFFANLPHCLVGMETGGGAHYWAREIMAAGHEVKIMAAQFVKPYIKTNKSDTNDAEGICEAVTRPTMRFVAVKTAAQQDIQCVHRIRERIVKSRTALSNEIRGFLTEYGIVLDTGIRVLQKSLFSVLSDQTNQLTPTTRRIIQELFHGTKVLTYFLDAVHLKSRYLVIDKFLSIIVNTKFASKGFFTFLPFSFT